MAHVTSQFDYSKLSVAERIVLVQDIWDSIAEEQSNFVLSDAEKQEIDRRIENYQKSGTQGRTWEEVKQRMRQEDGTDDSL